MARFGIIEILDSLVTLGNSALSGLRKIRFTNSAGWVDLVTTPTSSTGHTITLPAATGTVIFTSTFAAPPAIGDTTPNTGNFTTLKANTTTGSYGLTVNSAAVSGGGHIGFSVNDSLRWLFSRTFNAETGSNAGSNFALTPADDSGALLPAAFTIDRATQYSKFKKLGVGTGTYNVEITQAATANRVFTLPDKDGTGAVVSDFSTPPPIGNTTPNTGRFSGLVMAGSGMQYTCSPSSTYLAFEVANSGGGQIYEDWSMDGSDFNFRRFQTSTTELQFNGSAGAYHLYNLPLNFTYTATSTASIPLISKTDSISGAVFQFKSASGSDRWAVGKTGETESGGNAGSNFGFYSFTDAGAFLNTQLVLERSTGLVKSFRLGVGTGSFYTELVNNATTNRTLQLPDKDGSLARLEDVFQNPRTLTDGPTIAWNPSNNTGATVTIAGNRLITFSGTIVAGTVGFLRVVQDSTGGRGLNYNGVTDLILNTTANAVTLLMVHYDGSTYRWFYPVAQDSQTRIAEIVGNFSTASSGAQLVKSGSALAYAAPKFELPSAGQFPTTVDHTGTTAETVLRTYVLPANTLTTDGSYLNFYFYGLLTAVANNRTIRIRLGSVTGSVLHLATFSASTEQSFAHERRLFRATSSSLRSVTTTATNRFYDSNNTGSILQVTGMDWTVANTFVLTGQLTSSANTISISGLETTIVRV